MAILRRAMRTVSGPTDDVVIVGAGLAGLSCALRLAGAGRRVTVLEREAVPGGRAGMVRDAGFTFDTGPTVLTMPDLIQDALRRFDPGSVRPLRPTARRLDAPPPILPRRGASH